MKIGQVFFIDAELSTYTKRFRELKCRTLEMGLLKKNLDLLDTLLFPDGNLPTDNANIFHAKFL